MNVPLALMLVRMALRPISKTRPLWRLPFTGRSVGSHRFAVALDADRLAAKTSFLLSLLVQAATGRSS